MRGRVHWQGSRGSSRTINSSMDQPAIRMNRKSLMGPNGPKFHQGFQYVVCRDASATETITLRGNRSMLQPVGMAAGPRPQLGSESVPQRCFPN